MIIDAISDLHGYYPKLEGGDLLIIAGDLTASDDPEEFIDFKKWLVIQAYRKTIIIAGNHDNLIQKKIMMGPQDNWSVGWSCYLEDSGTEFEGLKIWGSPWTRNFYGQNPDCKAFGLDTDTQLKEKFDLIPSDTDILITHSPPLDILDDNWKNRCGSPHLRNMVLSRERLPNLKLHIFGHIHEEGGQIFETTLCKFVNASYVNEHYMPINKPVRVIL